MKYKSGLKVFAPASVANVAVGYDIMGFPIDGIGDEVIIKEGKTNGLVIKAIYGNKSLSKEIEKNTAGYAAHKLLAHLDMLDLPIEMELHKKMAIGTGMGSSAASAVAGVFAVNEYLDRPLEKKDLLEFATLGEQIADGSFHADNVAPSLLGSIVLIRDNKTLDFVKLPSPEGLKCILVHPHVQVLTKDSRNILSKEISLDSHIQQSGNLAAFVASLYKSDLDLMQRSLQDLIIEPQRAKLIPEFYSIKKLALKNNAIGCSISGAGPSIFALCQNSVIAENIQQAWTNHLYDHKIDHDIYISDINKEGARLY